jgi:hypothetical protein
LLLVVTFALGFVTAIVLGGASADSLFSRDGSSFVANIQAAPLVITLTGTRTPRVPTSTSSSTATATFCPTVTPTNTPTPVAPSVRLTLRAVYEYNGIPGSVQTPLYGGAGMTITDNGASPTSIGGDFVVTFPVGTRINPKTSQTCYFVPMVQVIGNSGGTTNVSGVVENADGSGHFEFFTGYGDLTSVIVVSANC